MWGSLSRSRRAAVKRGALVFVILVGIVGAVDKYNKDATSLGEVLPWHKGGYMDHTVDLGDGAVGGGGTNFAGGRNRNRWDGSIGVGDGDEDRRTKVGGGGVPYARTVTRNSTSGNEGWKEGSSTDAEVDRLGNEDAAFEGLGAAETTRGER